MSGRTGFLATAEGSRPGAFGATEWLLLVGAATIWGSSYLWIEVGLRGLDPGVVATARVALGLLTIQLIPGTRIPIERADVARLWVLGLGWFTLPMLTFPWAQELGVSSSVVGMLNGAVPLVTAFFASLLLRRLPRGRQVVGLVVGFAGLAAISAPTALRADATAIGVALILGTMLIGGLLVSLLVPIQQRYGALPVLRFGLRVALLFTLPFGIAGLGRSQLHLPSLLAMIPLGVLSTGLATVLWVTLIGRAGASRGSIVNFLIPVVAIVLGVTILGESVHPLALAGSVAVLLGAWAVSGRERQRGDAQEAS